MRCSDLLCNRQEKINKREFITLDVTIKVYYANLDFDWRSYRLWSIYQSPGNILCLFVVCFLSVFLRFLFCANYPSSSRPRALKKNLTPDFLLLTFHQHNQLYIDPKWCAFWNNMILSIHQSKVKIIRERY